MQPFPSVFVSHGSPDLLLYPSPALGFLKQLGSLLGKPKAILVVSAHFFSRLPLVSIAPEVEAMHDFWGFPPALYQLSYPASGAPELAEQVVKLLATAGFEYEVTRQRTLDHGAWEPLMLMYPDGDIPITQLSIQPHQSPTHHLILGRALAPLRQEGVLILASGATTHNLGSFGAYLFDAPPPEWVVQFDQWLATKIALGNTDELLDYRRLAPHAAKNHPSEEHLLPLFVAMGAGGTEAKGTQLHSSFTYGVFSMAAYAFC